MDQTVEPSRRSPAETPTYQGRPLANPDEDINDQGLAFDLETVIDRRRVLKLLGYTSLSAGLFAIIGCTPGSSASPSATTATSSAGPSASPSAGALRRNCRLRRHSRGDGRTLSRRRLERPGRAEPERRRP